MTPMVRGLSQPENMKTDHQQFVFKLWVLYANLPATKYLFDQSGNGEKNLKRPTGRGRPKKASSCHCGCEKRMDRAWILGSYVFAMLQCVYNFVSAETCGASERQAPIEKLETEYGDYCGVDTVLAELQQLQAGEDLMWQDFLRIFIYLVFLADFRRRKGNPCGQDCLSRLLPNFKYKTPFETQKRCMFHYVFDTTSLWMINTWIRPGGVHYKIEADLLSHLALVTICFNAKKVAEILPGPSGFSANLTAYDYFLLRKDLKDLPRAPVGGITGVGRAALFSVLRRLGIVSEDRDSYNFYEAMGLYVEHVLRTRGILFSKKSKKAGTLLRHCNSGGSCHVCARCMWPVCMSFPTRTCSTREAAQF